MKFAGILLFSALIFTTIHFTACNKNDALTPELKYDYYPLEVGHWISYRVDSIFFFNAALPTVIKDTVSFEIREEVASTFQDSEGRLVYRIERFKRRNENENWAIERVWSALRTQSNLQKVEDNLRFIKLIFPPKLNESWDGNVFISSGGDPALDYLQDWTYQVTELDAPTAINNLSFDSTVTVVQVDKENLIEKTYSIEQYAWKVGLIYKELRVLSKQNVNVGWDEPELGVIVRYRILDYKDR